MVLKNKYTYFNSLIEKTIENIDEILSLEKILSDSKSIYTLFYIVMFRLTLDKNYTKSANIGYEKLYFGHDIFGLGNKEIFVDCGPYIGDTLKSFLRRTDEKFKHYYAFEPDLNNYNELLKTGMKYNNITCFNKGVWKDSKVLKFNFTGNEMSRVSENGNLKIDVVSIDDVIKESSFIKMDIEGSEIEALQGARRNIATFKPKLAISAYHKPDHIFKIPKIIREFRYDYKIYLDIIVIKCLILFVMQFRGNTI